LIADILCMCGILGLVAPPGNSVGLDRKQIVSLRDVMKPRGPDEAGIFERNNIAFAHRRLSIRDIAGGSQPWVSDEGQCVLVYNGELYNDDPLRRELTAQGHLFRSHCDTETVMAAYCQWGTDCVEHLRGMFAFGIYDFRDDSLFLVRDRFGIKPLFLTEIDGVLIFASSIAALVAHPQFVKQPNFSVLSHYLTTFRLTLGRETMYQGIRQLLPGECLLYRNGQVQIERYWDYPAEEEGWISYDEAVEELHESLQDSVQSRLVSDVPVGMFLSGGVDSSTIACLTRQVTDVPMLGKCGGGEGDPSDEFHFARQCAEYAGFDFNEVRVSAEEYYDCWQWMLDQSATPLSTPTDVILYRLAQEMKKSVGVVLGGEGADELLCGYAVSHWAGYDYDRAQQLVSGTGNSTSDETASFRESLLKQYGRDRFTSPVDHYFALNSLIPTAVKPALFQPWVWKAAGEDRPMWNWYELLFRKQGNQETQRKQTTILHHVNLEGLLSRLDSATMLAGLEARVPYTDHLLVEKAFRMPRKYKIDVAHEERKPYLASLLLEQRGSLRSKKILRSVAARIMPHSMAHRKKASFPTPVQAWMTGRWQAQIRETLLTSPFGREVFRPEALTELADNLPQAGMWLWPLTNVLHWGDRQFAA